MTSGLIMQRKLADGRIIDVYPLFNGRARLCIGPANAMCYDNVW